MRRSSWVGLGVALVLLLAGAGWFLLREGTPPTPEQLITESLNDAEQAARKRNLSGVMEIVSRDFRAGGGLNRDRLRILLLRALNQSRGVDYGVQVAAPRIFPSPQGEKDKRLVVSRLSVFYNESGETIWGSNEPMVFVMREETRRKLLFLKEPRWRIVGVANLPPIPGGDDSSGGAMGGFGDLLQGAGITGGTDSGTK